MRALHQLPAVDLSVSHGFVSMTLGLLVVVSAILLIAFVAKRVGIGRFSQGKKIQVLSTLALSNKEKLALIKVKNKELLIGITPASINTLKEFDGSAAEDAEPPTNLTVNFAKQLTESLNKMDITEKR